MYKIAIVFFFIRAVFFSKLNMQDIINEKGRVQIYENNMGCRGLM